MKRIDLVKITHNAEIGNDCPTLTPNVTEDSVFFSDGEPIGFFIKELPPKAKNLAEIANREFNSPNVPKSIMNRSAGEMGTIEHTVKQMSCILGSVPPRPHMRRPYPSISRVHLHQPAEKFIKAMLLLGKESEEIIRSLLPDQAARQEQALSNVNKKWRFGQFFTSSISNYNIAASYHRDNGNIIGTCNAIITKRLNATGGNLTIPDYGATIGSEDNSLLVYPAWRNVHGVTPILPTSPGGYRNSLVFYALKAFVGI